MVGRSFPTNNQGVLVASKKTVVAVAAGVLAAVLPARRAARTDVLVALAYE